MARILFQQSTKRLLYLTFLILFTGGMTFFAVVLPFVSALSESPPKEGDVASQDIRAPYALEYNSALATEEQRIIAVQSVEPIYTQADTSVARHQLERLRATISYINNVRADPLASIEQKLDDLAALEDIQFTRETSHRILEMSNARWQAIHQEATVVLEQVMRTTIREDRLNDVHRSIPAMISLTLPEDQANTVAELVSGFVVPNSLYNSELTELARIQAREAVVPITRSYAAGETIVQRGRLITEQEIEALSVYDLLQTRFRWQELVSAFVLVALVLSFLTSYLKRAQSLNRDFRKLNVLVFLFLLFIITARLATPGHTVIPYLIPMAAFGLIIAALFGAEPAIVAVLPLSILSTYGLPYSFELTLYYTLGSLVGILILGRARRITSFFWSGFAISCANAAVVFIFRLPQANMDWVGLLTLFGASIINGAASAGIALLLQYFFSQLLGMTTALQLLELSRPDHPLLQLVLRNAPGTYQHSLQVANLAEQAAEKIGADAFLTRVGALYHDVGKAGDSIFFIENQVPGNINPHDNMDPSTSAAVIIRHIPKGIELARKYRLPSRIQDFIREHHGAMVTRYQYAKAVEVAGGDESMVDVEEYRYPGPRPQSKETALLMLADGCEARVRAERPKDEAELRLIVQNVVDASVANGALYDTDLTLKDLNTIVNSFTSTLRGVYHPRIQYPKLEDVISRREEERTEPLALPEPAADPPVPSRTEASTSVDFT
jgi:cyclic-di-AMP phosphodiesterase PgpH